MNYNYFKINIKMEAINYIKKYHKKYIGDIDYNYKDNDGYNYIYYYVLYNPLNKYIYDNYDKNIKQLDITQLLKKYINDNKIEDIINYNYDIFKNNINILITNYFNKLESIYESDIEYKKFLLNKYYYNIYIYIDNNYVDNINIDINVKIIKNKKIKNLSCYWIEAYNSTIYKLNINKYYNKYDLTDNGNIINNCNIKELIITNCIDTININNSNIEILNIKNYELTNDFPSEKINIKKSKINELKINNCSLNNIKIKNNKINLLNLKDNYSKNNYKKINKNNEIKNLIFNVKNFNLENLNLNIINNKKVIIKDNKDIDKEKYKSIKINTNIFYYNESEFIIINK